MHGSSWLTETSLIFASSMSPQLQPVSVYQIWQPRQCMLTQMYAIWRIQKLSDHKTSCLVPGCKQSIMGKPHLTEATALVYMCMPPMSSSLLQGAIQTGPWSDLLSMPRRNPRFKALCLMWARWNSGLSRPAARGKNRVPSEAAESHLTSTEPEISPHEGQESEIDWLILTSKSLLSRPGWTRPPESPGTVSSPRLQKQKPRERRWLCTCICRA